MDTLSKIKKTLVAVLQLNGSNTEMDRNTQLLGAIPELDSMAVVSVVTALEEIFDIVFDDEEVTAEMFETVGTLCDVVEQKM